MKRYKKDFTYSYTIGVFPTLELLLTRPKSVIKVITNSKGDRNSGLAKIVEICQSQSIPVETSDYLIAKLSDNENTYAIGVFHKYESKLATNENHVVLVNPSDRGNLGTILRTMLAFDFKNLAIISPAVDHFDPKVIRASMGALFHINVVYFPDFIHYSSTYSHNLYPLMTGGKTSLPEVKFISPFTLVFGNESAGLDESYRLVGQPISIPQSKQVDSLNLAMAVGISLYSSRLQTVPGS